MGTHWYVATLARYVLVVAADAGAARLLGEAQLGSAARTVRPADPGEVQLQHWFDAQVAADSAAAPGPAPAAVPAPLS